MNKVLDKSITKFLEANKDKFIADIRGLLQFNSVKGEKKGDMLFGEENGKCLDFMMNLCESYGFVTMNYDYYCMDAIFGKGEKSIGSLSHLDIVPAGEGWQHNPFAGEIVDNVMYGRGVIDDKGPSIAALYGLLALMDYGFTPKKTIKLIFGCDEETGMGDIEYYLSKADAPDLAFSPDADFPVVYAEKNIFQGEYECKLLGKTNIISLDGGTAVNAVPSNASATISYDKKPEDTENIKYSFKNGELTIKAKGITTHASTPQEGDNAIIKLIKAILPLLSDDDTAKKSLHTLLDTLTDINGKGLDIYCEDEPTGKSTLNFGIISFDNNTIKISIDVRHPVTCDTEILLKKLNTGIPEFSKTSDHFLEGLYKPKDSQLVSTLQSVYHDITGDYDAEPVSMGGGTYARTLPNAVAFGPHFPGGNAGGAHIVDEHCDIDELLKAARIYAHCFYELAKDE